MDTRVNPPMIAAEQGERCQRTLRFSRDDIAAFAQLSGDANPLHHDQQAALRARHGEIIASGQQVSAMLMGLAASHFSRAGEGFTREYLCLNTNFAFKAPVFADQSLELSWAVTEAEWHERLGGWLVQAHGQAGVRLAKPAVVARGTFLVKPVPV
ncbi:MaoC family dehydratase [Aquabacterium sp. OR-4]|uniref:MaoC family dehydratase n=1 Tax=Aquabacterium sp. OR-4 TaxID=2978127 RepID=UPI0021B19319|nr:MaoC family dehydratase [Aquabacterium sp. OR-4]MDT7834327.1 MaoC family dehydratase [Aquabacterium sp. OR-4]